MLCSVVVDFHSRFIPSTRS